MAKQEKPEYSAKEPLLVSRNQKLDFNQPICLKNVSMTRGLQPILKRVNLRIRARSRVAILSIEGGGRSNIYDLLTSVSRRDNRDTSSISLFGHRIEALSDQAIKTYIFVVERDPVLLERTVGDNVDPYGRFRPEEVEETVRKLGLGVVLYKQAKKEEVGGKRKKRRGDIDIGNEEGAAGVEEEEEEVEEFLEDVGGGFLEIPGEEDLENSNSKDKSNEEIEMKVRGLEEPNQKGRNSPLRSGGDKEVFKMALRVDSDVKVSLVSPSPTSNLERKRKKLSDNSGNSLLPESGRRRKYSEINQEVNTPKRLKLVSRTGIINLKEIKNQGSNIEDKSRPTDSRIKIYDILKKGEHINDQSRVNESVGSMRLEGMSEKKFLSGSNCTGKLSRFTNIKNFRKDILQSSPFAAPSLVNTLEKEEIEDRASEELPQENIKMFLNFKVGFQGKNLSHAERKLVLFSRVLLEKPKLLLTYEESLDFGKGIEFNLGLLSVSLPETTIVCISKNASCLLSYEKVFFMDAGKVLEKGNPKALILNEQSHLHRFLKEAEKDTLNFLMEKLEELQSEDDHVLKGLEEIEFDSKRNSDSFAGKADRIISSTYKEATPMSLFHTTKDTKKTKKTFTEEISTFHRKSQFHTPSKQSAESEEEYKIEGKDVSFPGGDSPAKKESQLDKKSENEEELSEEMKDNLFEEMNPESRRLVVPSFQNSIQTLESKKQIHHSKNPKPRTSLLEVPLMANTQTSKTQTAGSLNRLNTNNNGDSNTALKTQVSDFHL